MAPTDTPREDRLITSPANPRVKELVALRRRRVRDAQRVVVVDGVEESALAVEAGARVRTLFHCPELMPPGASDLVDRVRSTGTETVRLSRAAFEKAAYREGPDGVLLVADSVERTLDELDEMIGPDPLVLVSQGVEKPGNLGAMLRTADAAGVSAVVAADPVTDWSNPNVVRGSKGTVFAVPVAAASTERTMAWARERGIRTVATTPDTDTLHTEVDLTGPVAILMGTEKQGLTDETLAAADVRVRIPMAGTVNSLNVATAAAIVVYEAVRQRR
ncbi:RNA methyltransferase [Nostocoides sp. F2B08]|uniref:TrmH family RNA methyltransferase n=1 Tax=Nostocoides sp. F2B08 TaxID=2653936 RepID=UPI001262DEE1|nr:TrmH family RNA methyltransferase [Tetrasphaera sp. F2B08]KAB7743998.1 RNA methyltransferase [Tetrasphaera sp. F2B08]